MDVLSRLPYIYDIATSDENWTTALDHFAEATGAKGVAISASKSSDFDFQIEATNSFYTEFPSEVRHYLSRYREYEEHAANIVLNTPAYKRVDDHAMWPGFIHLKDREDLAYLRKSFGIFRRSAYKISEDPAWNALVVLHYDQSVEEILPEWHRDAQILVQHLGKALEINRLCFGLRQKYDAVLSVLDHINVGICVALPTGEVLTQNRRAQQIFEDNDGLLLDRFHHIQFTGSEQTNTLMSRISACAATAAGNANSIEETIQVERLSGKEAYLIEVSPLRDGAGELEGHFTGALILIVDPANPPEVSVVPLQVLYNLTAAEGEIAKELLAGKSIPEIAEMRGVALDTVKNQSKAIYSKTSVFSRAQLIRKAVSISPPTD